MEIWRNDRDRCDALTTGRSRPKFGARHRRLEPPSFGRDRRSTDPAKRKNRRGDSRNEGFHHSQRERRYKVARRSRCGPSASIFTMKITVRVFFRLARLQRRMIEAGPLAMAPTFTPSMPAAKFRQPCQGNGIFFQVAVPVSAHCAMAASHRK